MNSIKLEQRNINYGKYSFAEYLRLLYSKFLTLIFYHPARLIRRPSRIRGQKNILWSRGFTCGYNCRIEAFSLQYSNKYTLLFGENTNIGDFCHISAIELIKIGDNVLMGSGVFITDHDHGYSNEKDLMLSPIDRDIVSGMVVIEDNVWIGEKAIILKGVNVGRNSVIAAGALVTKDIEPFSVYAGVPAKKLR